MYNNKKISIVFPAYNEEKGIKKAIEDFFSLKEVDEIIVVDNNSKDKTAEIVKKTKAKLIKEKKQGYGFALIRGLKEAKGDLIFTIEPDGTFESKNIHDFLKYEKEYDVIFGTRTNMRYNKKGSKMSYFLRLGNIALAKMIQFLYKGQNLTDVGCTFKMIKKNALKKIQRRFKEGRSAFSPEFMILCLKEKLKIIEIPVIYKKRVGDSKITNNFWNSFKLGLRMINIIIKYKRIK
jgi:glycosyltransferase involved in cell wall biosynthesis